MRAAGSAANRLVGKHSREILGLLDHLFNLLHGRNDLGQTLLSIDFLHLGNQILRIAGRQLLHGIDTGGFKQFGELRPTVDAEKIGMIDPCENVLLGNTVASARALRPFASFPFSRS